MALALATVLARVTTSDRPAEATTSRTVAALVAATLDEKLAMLHGGEDPAYLGQSGYVAGVPRLGIPELRLVDGAPMSLWSLPTTTRARASTVRR